MIRGDDNFSLVKRNIYAQREALEWLLFFVAAAHLPFGMFSITLVLSCEDIIYTHHLDEFVLAHIIRSGGSRYMMMMRARVTVSHVN